MADCPSCGGSNPDGHRFCGHCGGALAADCPACGQPSRPGERFCGACGAALAATAPAPAARPEAPTAERRIVSVLFADLVGFTSLSESRDPEEVRELLSRYFDTCRRLVELYGGTIEKFIGDAVMAVWGTPVAQEDDAERAVRAGLDLVAAVSALGDEVGARELRARAGVLTGEAAVNIGAVGEGMVAGDLVNSAARIQAVADPGSVLVGDGTRRASERAIVYEDAGEREVKGKAEPVRVHRAVRVMAARGGALRSEGLEAPFVGRERELRLVKELYHVSAEQSRAQLVQITGIPGIGKSRLAWEYFKYSDGLLEEIWWHRGRCLAYGEGVAYWALAEMVRTRAQILEGEDQETARHKLAATLAEHVPDAEERAWIGPRLANLLGLDDRADTDRQDLFAAWRLFFERLADQGPLVMVFEDLQWADQALLDFVEYLLEWSTSQPIFVIALARPELVDHHPDFGRSIRNSTSIALEPLRDDEMIALLDGYVPGLPEDLRAQVLARAQGVPLYAVETVRMLLDRGLVTRDGPVYRPTEEIRTLEIPETLHALAAARLDGLPPEERAVVQQACVLGKTFTKRALARLVGTTEEELDPLLTGLVRKEVLSLQADPRWPERGQYGFLQELLRQVAYETLSRRDRKLRHLAAVTALEATFEGADQEVPEVIAAHLLAAAEASPDDADTPEIRARARAALVQAGDRAAALAAPDEAQRYIDQAAALADDDPVAQAALLEEAGRLAVRGGRIDDARDRLERAIAQFEALGERQAATRAGVALADVAIFGGRIDEAVGRFESAVEALEADGLSEELATTLASLGRLYALRGDTSTAAPLLERTLTLAEALRLDELFVQALTSKGVVLIGESRLQEARLLLEAAVERAEAGSYAQSWTRAMNNLGAVLESSDELYAMVSVAARSWEFAQRRGDRESAATARYGVLRALFEIGEWDDVAQRVEEAQDAQASPWSIGGIVDAVPMYCERGDLETATEIVNRESWQRSAEQTEVAAAFASAEARLLRAQGLPQKALEVATRAVRQRGEVPFAYASIRGCLMEALEAALQLGDPAAVAELLEIIDALRPGEVSPLLGGHRSRVDALARAASGDEDGVESSFRSAEATFHTAGAVFRRAVTLVEHGEWLAGHGRSDEAAPLLDDARVTFVRLAAEPWLDRIDAVTAPTAAAAD